MFQCTLVPWRALLAILAMLHGSSFFEARVDYFLDFFLRESSDSCGHFMSYKVSAIIIPFCRNLLAPAMMLDFLSLVMMGCRDLAISVQKKP